MHINYFKHDIIQAVSDLVMGGATQVYIRAASLHWRILQDADKRIIPKNLLRKMVRMKVKTEGVKLADYPPNQHRDILPLNLVYLSHRYSLCLNTQQEDIEVVVDEIWKEEWERQFSIQPESPYENYSHKSQCRHKGRKHSIHTSKAFQPRPLPASKL